MKSSIGDKERLGHILDAVSFIEQALNSVDEKRFRSDFILHTAILKWLENIGEATYKLTRSFKSSHPQVEWRQIEGLRHILVHEYFGIDLQRIWQTVEKDVPLLKSDVEGLYNNFMEAD